MAFSTLRVYKEVITSLSKNYCRSSHLNGNQSEVLKKMIDFCLYYVMEMKCLIRFTKISLKAFINLVRDVYGMI